MTGIPATWTWGSSTTLKLSPALGSNVSAQLAQVTLPEPAVCSIYFQATARITNPDVTSVGAFTLNLNQGLGRVTIPRQVSFAGQPSDQSPLEWTMPFVPLHALNVDVECTGDFRDFNGGEIEIQIYLLVAPITRIKQSEQKMKFGMAMPGEADALDDELRENLEDESPTVAEIMGKEAHERVHGVDGEGPEEHEPEEHEPEEPAAAPAWMLDLVDALSQRLGRAPTRAELGRAVQRVQQRNARRRRG